MNTKDILTGVKFQPPMVAANMFVVPITSENPLDSLSGEMLLQITSDTDYSRLTLRNVDNKPVIVPSGLRFFAEKGQDRVIKKTSVLAPESEEEVPVGCIEPSDSAHIQSGRENYSFIPAQLRVPTLEKQDDTGYETIWEDIKKYLADAGISGDAMKSFYRTFDKELEEFVAQFEPIKNQVGAVIFINNQVAGIEIYPNHQAWLKVWRLLIRDSYGADALGLIRSKTVATFRPLINIDRVNKLEDLKKEVARTKLEYSKFVFDKIESILNAEIMASEPSVSNEYAVHNIQADGYIGQWVKLGDKTVYFSLLKR